MSLEPEIPKSFWREITELLRLVRQKFEAVDVEES